MTMHQMALALTAAAATTLHTGTAVQDGWDGADSYGYQYSGWNQYTTLTGGTCTVFFYDGFGNTTYMWFSSDLNGTGNIKVTMNGIQQTLTRGTTGHYTVAGNPWTMNGSGVDNFAVTVVAA